MNDIETVIEIRFTSDNLDEANELVNEIKRLMKNSYVSFNLEVVEQN